ncbi:MAG: AMP-dependent synthetase/ligase [Pseudomonadota bacterium]
MARHSPNELITVDRAGTLSGLFSERVRLSADAVAYREHDVRSGRWLEHSWRDMDRRIARARGALSRAGIEPGDRVAIGLPNGTDWVCFDIAALSLGLIVVPLYLHDSPGNLAYILSDSGARVLIIDSASRWHSLLSHWPELIDLEHVWIRNGFTTETRDLARPGVEALADILEQEGEAEPWPDGSPDDTATIIYTSGTTGKPKGAMLSHRAILRNAAMTAEVVPPRADDRLLSCLPLAHAFERTVGYYLPMLGGAQVVYSRSIEALAEDLRTQCPTVFLGVPRLYERAVIAIRERAGKNRLKRLLLDATAALGWRRVEARQSGRADLGPLKRIVWRLLDRWVASQVRAAFGAKLRIAVSGGAPLPVDVARFLIGLGIPLVEGYGLTEAGPVVTASDAGNYVPGTVGPPLRGIELAMSGRGELLIRSPSLMKGYWRNDALTAEAIDARGWLHTGDLAELRDGYVVIAGRLKELIALSTGEKVAPASIEASILRDPMFQNVLIVGDGRPFLAAVISLSSESWKAIAAAAKVPAADPAHASARDHVLRLLKERLAHLGPHEQVRGVHLTLDQWSVENGLLTPTLKTKRAPLQRMYESDIERIYAAGRARIES